MQPFDFPYSLEAFVERQVSAYHAILNDKLLEDQRIFDFFAVKR